MTLDEQVESEAYDEWERDQAKRRPYVAGKRSNAPEEILRRAFAPGERLTAGRLNQYLWTRAR